LKCPFISSCSWIRIWWVEWGDSAAVRAIDGIQKVVEESGIGVVGLIYWIICLEQDCILWIE
jgi:hypothetical protein